MVFDQPKQAYATLSEGSGVADWPIGAKILPDGALSKKLGELESEPNRSGRPIFKELVGPTSNILSVMETLYKRYASGPEGEAEVNAFIARISSGEIFTNRYLRLRRALDTLRAKTEPQDPNNPDGPKKMKPYNMDDVIQASGSTDAERLTEAQIKAHFLYLDASGSNFEITRRGATGAGRKNKTPDKEKKPDLLTRYQMAYAKAIRAVVSDNHNQPITPDTIRLKLEKLKASGNLKELEGVKTMPTAEMIRDFLRANPGFEEKAKKGDI